MRHGLSEANKLNLITSQPDNGLNAYGLTAEGEQDIKKKLSHQLISALSEKSLIILCSPFLRTFETACLVKSFISDAVVIRNDRLRERCFGEFEKTDSTNYDKVWKEDNENLKHKNREVESVFEVAMRLLPLLLEIEKSYSNKNILCVSHGDICNILFSLFERRNPKYHNLNYKFATGEIKKMRIKNNMANSADLKDSY
jgi:probable phosphoglycerate mutase